VGGLQAVASKSRSWGLEGAPKSEAVRIATVGTKMGLESSPGESRPGLLIKWGAAFCLVALRPGLGGRRDHARRHRHCAMPLTECRSRRRTTTTSGSSQFTRIINRLSATDCRGALGAPAAEGPIALASLGLGGDDAQANALIRPRQSLGPSMVGGRQC
jgi:hypothetical protein